MSKLIETPNAKTLQARALKANVNACLINAIDYSGYTVPGVDQAGNVVELPIICEDTTAQVNFVMQCFEDEYIQPNKRNGNKVTLFADWLVGLPSVINIEFRNHAIIEIAKEWNSIPATATERQEDKILGNWFNFIANKFFQLHKQLNNKK